MDGFSWREIDTKAPLPTLEELVTSVRRIRFVPAAEEPAALSVLVRELRSILLNGGVIAQTFAVENADATAAWFISRNNVNTYGLLTELLRSDGVRQSAPALGSFDAPAAVKTFDQTGALSLDGDLAAALVWGGAYGEFGGSQADAKRLGVDACRALFGDRYEDVCVHRSRAPWSPWFFDVAWDNSWIITDLRTQQMTLLCLTDTD